MTDHTGTTRRRRESRAQPFLALLSLVILAACAAPPALAPIATALPHAPPADAPVLPATDRPAVALDSVIPRPAVVEAAPGAFALTRDTAIVVDPGAPELAWIGEELAARLRTATTYPLPVVAGEPRDGAIAITAAGADPTLGDEDYALTITPARVELAAPGPAGAFYGAQTIRQLLPADAEWRAARPGPWLLPAGAIRDTPRFAWRGAMLDVARHFFGVADVKRFVDLLAYYKLNRLHLHLSDDQGWRIAITAWPKLASYGGSTAVGGGRGGFFTQAEYAEIAAYAAARYITVVPEIDMPGHTTAALASYPELTCDGVAPPLYTGIEVGFSTLCVGKEEVITFVDDVVRELAAITPGPYIHIGGDEAVALGADEYRQFVERAQAIVQAHGKAAVGWEEVAHATLLPSTVVQHWRGDAARLAVAQGAKIIMSPSSRVYLDMKYHAGTPIGLRWAGYIEVQDAYAWDPASQLSGIGEADVLGVEAPIWTETIVTREHLDFMAFPRLAAVAEVGWSPASRREWVSFRERLGGHGPRLAAMGVQFYRSEQIPWQPMSS